jgi:16S rRNA (uracil1498-N3)-methyltransferase
MEYFYVPADHIVRTECILEGEEFAHLTHVMRRSVGDVICLVDGAGTGYDVVIEEISRRQARCRILAKKERMHEPSIHLTLGAAVLKNGANFDFLVEKATELGASALVPLLTERTLPHHARTERWQKIALAAMKQSGRSVLPRVSEPERLDVFLKKNAGAEIRLLPHEKTVRPHLQDIIPVKEASVALAIGPEGGFSEEEVELAVAAGFIPVSLGPRRLRAETAALVTVGLLLLQS